MDPLLHLALAVLAPFHAQICSLKPVNFHKNLELADALASIASKKGISTAQLTLAWAMAQWDGIIPIPGSTRPDGVREAVGALEVAFSAEELKEIKRVVDNAVVVGGRYNDHMASTLEG